MCAALITAAPGGKVRRNREQVKMKKFLGSKAGDIVVFIILAAIFMYLMHTVVGIGGALGGALAAVAAIAVQAIINKVFKIKEPSTSQPEAEVKEPEEK